MTTKNYRNTLVTAYRDRELSQADFADTVDHFEKLVRGDHEEDPTDMKSKLKDGFTVVYRRGDERIVKGDGVYLEEYRYNDLGCYSKCLKDETGSPELDIVSIRDTNNVEIWKRVDEVWVEVEQSEEEPPIDLLPREQYNSNRIIEIGQAIIRYTEAGKQVPSEWINELNELTC